MAKRCQHRYKGLYGNYEPRFRKTRDGYFITDYKCQIKGCNHWKLAHFKHKLEKKNGRKKIKNLMNRLIQPKR